MPIGKPEPDTDFRDHELVPLKEDWQDYVAREVTPFVPDAWVDESYRDERDREVGRVGYEINFNRYFYKYVPPRPLAEIDGELKALEAEIAGLLTEVMTVVTLLARHPFRLPQAGAGFPVDMQCHPKPRDRFFQGKTSQPAWPSSIEYIDIGNVTVSKREYRPEKYELLVFRHAPIRARKPVWNGLTSGLFSTVRTYLKGLYRQ